MNSRELARAVTILDAANRLGIELRRDGRFELKGRCPRCDGALHVRSDKGRSGLFYCHASDAGGDPIDLVRHVKEYSFREAVRCLAQ